MTVAEYNQCVDSHSDNVYRFILKNLRDVEGAKDIVQDAFEKLWTKHREIGYDKAKAYLFTTAYHRLVDHTRKESRKTRPLPPQSKRATCDRPPKTVPPVRWG